MKTLYYLKETHLNKSPEKFENKTRGKDITMKYEPKYISYVKEKEL